MSFTENKQEAGEEMPLKGCTEVPAYKEINIESEEDWDAGTAKLPSTSPRPPPPKSSWAKFKAVNEFFRYAFRHNIPAILKQLKLLLRESEEDWDAGAAKLPSTSHPPPHTHTQTHRLLNYNTPESTFPYKSTV